MKKYDGILIPGGGLLDDGSLTPWTKARLELALKYKDECRWFILLSGGTVHKPPPLNEFGYPIFESRVSAKYLGKAGINPDRILTEISSYDTIGNAHFARLLFTEPLSLKMLLIITSQFHMPRTRAIFEWVFQLSPLPFAYQLYFESSPNTGLPPLTLSARDQREKNSLENLRNTIQKINTIDQFITWLYMDHAAYAPYKTNKPLSEDELSSY